MFSLYVLLFICLYTFFYQNFLYKTGNGHILVSFHVHQITMVWLDMVVIMLRFSVDFFLVFSKVSLFLKWGTKIYRTSDIIQEFNGMNRLFLCSHIWIGLVFMCRIMPNNFESDVHFFTSWTLYMTMVALPCLMFTVLCSMFIRSDHCDIWKKVETKLDCCCCFSSLFFLLLLISNFSIDLSRASFEKTLPFLGLMFVEETLNMARYRNVSVGYVQPSSFCIVVVSVVCQ